jgi:hypothetical protein
MLTFMKPDRLNCPSCGTRYPISRLLFQVKRTRCPSCGTLLSLSTGSIERIATIAGLSFAIAFFVIGPERLHSGKVFLGFLLLSLVYGRLLVSALGSLVIAPQNRTRDVFPNQQGIWKVFANVGLVGIAISSLAGLLFKYTSVPIPDISDIVIPSAVLFLLGMSKRKSRKEK